MDSLQRGDIVGTISGDDTFLCVMKDENKAIDLVRENAVITEVDGDAKPEETEKPAKKTTAKKAVKKDAADADAADEEKPKKKPAAKKAAKKAVEEDAAE